ncbi:Mycothiol S-conjugate amidase [Polystyrenella longa]|uniref:Mycothiol S-conjugate amidase n=1 Tax=Polystyrenella longa TaxID=2528007 RepID=A0A518CKI0_9PLAN|nr:PIG-L family deacetylase [Polystyrenella longa]QDU79733.1 Mycothiol S-conjugate amidase [Polystyrenella longa]
MSHSSKTPRILAIHAHPDDIEILCAGTLIRLQEAGCEIHLRTMTAGDCGSAEMSAEHIARKRLQEAQAAADLMGASYDCLHFLDLQIVHDNESRRRVTEELRQVQPDIVITAPPVDYMSDHEMTSRLVRDACFNAAVPNYDTQAESPALPMSQIPYLYFVDPVGGVDYYDNPIDPEFIIDVSRQFELKQKMLACHESQRAWLRKQHGMDEYLESSLRWSETRGSQIKAQYGEGFRQYKGHPYPHDNLIQEILGQGPLVV